MALTLAAGLAACLAPLGVTVAMSAEDSPYSVPAKPWDEGLGKHRACLQVDQAGDAVWAHIQWRRRDHDAARKQIIVVDAKTGKRVQAVRIGGCPVTCADAIAGKVVAGGSEGAWQWPLPR